MRTATTPRRPQSRRWRLDWRGRIVAWSGTLLILNALMTLGLLQVLLAQTEREAIVDEFGFTRQELEALWNGAGAESPGIKGTPVCAPGEEAPCPPCDVDCGLFQFLQNRVQAREQTMFYFVDREAVSRLETRDLPRIDDVPALLDAFLDAPEGETRTAEVEGESFLWTTHDITDEDRDQTGRLVVATFLGRRLADVSSDVVVAGLLQMAVGVVLLGLLGDRLSAGLALPLARLTERTRRIQATGIDEDLPVIGDDEVAALATTINELLDQTRQELATRRRLVADAGHELRTPITIVRGHLELLPDDPVERAEVLELVDDELERMSGLVSDLLALATADQPGFVRTGPVDLGDFGRRLLATVEPLSAERQWRLEVDEVPAELDERRIRQAVVALVDNAVRHTDAGGTITIRLRRPRDEVVEVQVADDGEGVPDDIADVVFAPFRHGHGQRRGTGLGLALVAAIALGHGGRAILDTEPGRGTTITLVLPQDMEE